MQNNKKNIYLIGMPSSGKSTLGRALALTMGYEYVDMDEIIVQNEHRSISQIFQESGEDYFRKIETELLKSFLSDQKKVISTGGGVPVFFDNMAFILANGISVYLDVLPQNLFERIYNSSKNDRPLIDKSDREKLLENLVEKYNNRFPFYSQANIIIKEDYSVAHIIEKLKKSI
ncbi:MAG: shikimate kinase [Bacteroidota bacterium]